MQRGILASWIAVACAFGAARAQEADERRAVVLITLEALRPDHLASFGWHHDTMPALDRWLAGSVTFERAYTPIPSSVGANASVLTAARPSAHGMTSANAPRPPFAESERARSVASHLAALRYRCAAFVSHEFVGSYGGLNAGFHTLDEPEQGTRDPAEVAAHVERWLDLHAAEPRLFLWVHLKGGQEPNLPAMAYMRMFPIDAATRAVIADVGVPPERFNQGGFGNATLIRMFFPELDGQVTPKGTQLSPVTTTQLEQLYERYDGDLRATDDALARIFDRLERTGLSQRAVVAVCSVGGQALGEQVVLGRGEVIPDAARVFAAIRAPGLAPQRSSKVVSLIDLVPTALSLARLGPKAAFGAGLDVLASERGHVLVTRPTREGEKNPPGPVYALYTERWCYVHRPEQSDKLFDLQRDPRARKDVRGEHPEEAARLRALVAAELAAQAK